MKTLTIRHEPMSPIFDKFHIEGLQFGAVIHHFTEPDTGDPHDHPFDFTTHILSGGYIERVYSIDSTDGDFRYKDIHRKPGAAHAVKATDIHQIISLPDGECFTLMIPGPWKRKSGFWRFDEDGVKFREWDQQEFSLIKNTNPS